MDMLISLWLPILLSAVAVWFWNFLSWSILPIHKGDYTGVPNEDAVMAFLRSQCLPPGNYAFPHPQSHADAKSPAFQEKWKLGPSGMLNIWPSKVGMGGKMLASFLVYLAVSILVAYIAVAAQVPKGSSFSQVMQVLGAAGVLGYCFAFLPNGIWFNAKPKAMLACFFDGIVAGLATGAIFAALWPK